MTAALSPTIPHSTRKRAAWQEAAGVPALLFVLTVIFFWPQVGAGRALYWGDIGLYFTPMTAFLHDQLRQGRLPLWDPLILCGTPFVGNPQAWPLYPVTALLPWVSAPYFLSLTVALHVWLAGVGAALFLRRALGVGAGASLLGAVTFMFGGWLVSKEQFPNMVQAAAYLPWVLWAVEGVLVRPGEAPGGPPPGSSLADPRPSSGEGEDRASFGTLSQTFGGGQGGGFGQGGGLPGPALTLGAIIGLQLLAAHAQMTLLTLYLAAAWGLFRLWQAHLARALTPHPPASGGTREAGRWVLAGRLALAGLVAFGLSAGQVLPTLQLFRDGWRQDLSFRVVDRFYLPLNQSANWVLPALHGHPYFGDFTARGNFWETCCYAGWVGFGLAAGGALLAWRRGGDGRVRFWAVAFGAGYLMALGGGAGHRPGPYWLAYHVLPGFHSFHDPARCLFWATFALAVLAAAGAQALLSRVRRPAPLAALLLLVAFADLAHFGRTLYPLADPAALSPPAPALAAVKGDPEVRAGQARFLAPDSARVWQRFTGHKDYREDAPDYQALWADTLTPNLPMAYGLPDAFGYEPVTRRDAQEALGALESDFRANAPPADRVRAAARAGALGVRFVATDRVFPPEASLPGLTPLLSDASLPPLGQAADPSRVYLSRNTRWLPRARLERPGAAPLAADITEDDPDRVVVLAAPRRPSVLVLADTDAPGWEATVDRRPAPLLRTQGFLRAVALPRPGPHTVVFTYRPATFLLGLYLSLLTLGGLAGAVTFSATRKFREETRPPVPNPLP